MKNKKFNLQKIINFFAAKITTKEGLQKLLQTAAVNHLITASALSMLESVLQLSEMHVRDIMLPRSQMVALNTEDNFAEFVKTITLSSHSRFPVYDGDLDNVVGILLAKDLLAQQFEVKENKFDVKELLRPAVFVPESKRLDVLLQEFRALHNHIAIVVDEYGRTSGLVTIEDVLEQIVGEIEDEHDIDEEDVIKKHDENHFVIKAHIPLEEFDEYFSTKFDDGEYDTLGGFVLHKFGYVPKRGESITVDDFSFKILLSDNRRIKLVEVVRCNAIA